MSYSYLFFLRQPQVEHSIRRFYFSLAYRKRFDTVATALRRRTISCKKNPREDKINHYDDYHGNGTDKKKKGNLIDARGVHCGIPTVLGNVVCLEESKLLGIGIYTADCVQNRLTKLYIFSYQKSS